MTTVAELRTGWRRIKLRDPGALAILAFLVLLHGVYSLAPSLGPAEQRAVYLCGSVVFAALLTGCWIFWRDVCGIERDLVRQPPPTLADTWFVIFLLVTASYFSLSNRIAAPLIAEFVAAQALFLVLGWTRVAVLSSSTILLTGLCVAVALVHLDRGAADMLPATIWADQTFLHGLNPYLAPRDSGFPAFFYYLPFEWLQYLPFYALGLDVRDLNLASVFGLIGLYVLFWRRIPRPWSGLALLLGIIASRPSTEMVYAGEVWPFWFILSAFAVAYSLGNVWISAVLLGLLLSSNQTAILLAAIVGAYQFRSGSVLKALLLGLITISVYETLILPFSGNMVSFIYQNYVVLPKIGSMAMEATDKNSIIQISSVNILAHLHILILRGSLQVVVGLAGLAFAFWGRSARPREVFVVLGITYMSAISLNTLVWKYYYIPGTLLLFWSVFAPDPGNKLDIQIEMERGCRRNPPVSEVSQ